ncbi:MAG: hypothetical protein ACI9Z9_002700, partial [Litorivivens sp.]
MKIENLLDLQRYPLHDNDDPLRIALVEQCKADLENQLYCVIPDIILPA